MDHEITWRALVLAGGRGSRLYPFTASLPKPLLPVGGRPVVEHILLRLAAGGIGEATIAVNYLGNLIETCLADGSRFGLRLSYFRETTPLGTAGALAHMEAWDGPLVVSNADVLSDIDIAGLIGHHCRNDAALTVAAMTQTHQIGSGVIEADGDQRITRIVEKPTFTHRISLGVYVVSPRARRYLGSGRVEMPDLINAMLAGGERIFTFDHGGFWLDIGVPDDFAKAQQLFAGDAEVAMPRPERDPAR